MKKKIIFVGCGYAGEYALRSLLNSPLRKAVEVVGVISHVFTKGLNPVITLANALEMPLFVGDPNGNEGLAWVESLKPNFGVMLEYPKKLFSGFLEQFEWMINAHPSDLPKLRGGAPIEGAILQQHPLVISIHSVDEKFDHGHCLYKTDPICIKGQHFEQVYELCAKLASSAILETIDKLLNGTQSCIPQDHTKASYLWDKDLEGLLQINWEQSDVFEIQRQILAAGPKRGASTFLKDGEIPIRFLRGRALAASHNELFGKLHSIEEKDEEKTLCIFAKDGILLIDEYSIEKSLEHLLVPKKTSFKKYAICRIST